MRGGSLPLRTSQHSCASSGSPRWPSSRRSQTAQEARARRLAETANELVRA
jgi:hypothetical protein